MTLEELRIVAFTLRIDALSTALIVPFGLAIASPVAARGIAGGVILAFARAIGEFGATILVAGDIPGRTTTLSLAIYDRVQLGRDTDAYRLLAVAVVIAFVTLWTSEILLHRRNAA